MRAVVYTAIFGGYDTLKQPSPQDQPCDFVCFTDSKLPSRVGAWRVIHVRRDHKVHPRLQAKRFKLLSHKIFPHGRLAARYAPFSVRRGADLSIWIDASLEIKCSTFVRDMRDKLGDRDWAMFVHPDRDCIYEEALLSIRMRKYLTLPILPQAEAYRSVVPPRSGLYACTIIVRREPSTERLNRVHQLWWDENVKWTYQDQISLPYVLRCVGGCDPAVIMDCLWQNRWFDIAPHNSDD
jgi:alkaline ceramidase TOD1/glycosyltransferase MUCI70-like protein